MGFKKYYQEAVKILEDADPDTSIDEIPGLMAKITHWECAECGSKKIKPPENCQRCNHTEFLQVKPDKNKRDLVDSTLDDQGGRQ